MNILAIPIKVHLNFDGLNNPGDAYYTGGPYASEAPSDSPDASSRAYSPFRYCTHPTRLTFLSPYPIIGDSAPQPPRTIYAGIRIAGEGAWNWNGDYLLPTVTPSIQVFLGEEEIWHGYLVNGVFRLIPPDINESANCKHWEVNEVPMFTPTKEMLEASEHSYKFTSIENPAEANQHQH